MRFRARLGNEHIQLIYSLIGQIARIKPEAIIHLDREKVRISTKDSDGISCFSELQATGGIFLDHKIESVANNAIVFEIDLLQWRTALQSVLYGGEESNRRHRRGNDYYEQRSQAAVSALESSISTMKLAKRNGGIPCLCIDAMSSGSSVELHHAIPITVMRVEDAR